MKKNLLVVIGILLLIISCSQFSNESEYENNDQETAEINTEMDKVEGENIPAVELFYDDFETGVIDWSDKYGAVIREDSLNTGNHVVRFSRMGEISKNISTEGYTDLKVSLRLKSDIQLRSYGPGTVQEVFYIAYSKDNEWFSIAEITESSDDYVYYEYEIPAEMNNNPDFVIRLFAYTLGYDSENFIDEVKITGVPSILGDVNRDGKIDNIDAEMTAQYYVGLNPEGFYSEFADVNGDEIINVIDALIIQQYFEGVINAFPVQ